MSKYNKILGYTRLSYNKSNIKNLLKQKIKDHNNYHIKCFLKIKNFNFYFRVNFFKKKFNGRIYKLLIKYNLIKDYYFLINLICTTVLYDNMKHKRKGISYLWFNDFKFQQYFKRYFGNLNLKDLKIFGKKCVCENKNLLNSLLMTIKLKLFFSKRWETIDSIKDLLIKRTVKYNFKKPFKHLILKPLIVNYLLFKNKPTLLNKTGKILNSIKFNCFIYWKNSKFYYWNKFLLRK